MSDFNKCPNGHGLPNKMGAGECTPVRCGASEGAGEAHAARAAKRKAPKVSQEVSPPSAGPASPSDSLAKIEKAIGDEETRIALASKKHEKWMAFLKAPMGLSGDEAEKYADGKLASLLPAAVTTLEKFLRFGTDEQQERAARQILEANGRGKRDAIAASTPPIVIHVNGVGGVSLPWRQEKLVDGAVIPASEKSK